MAELKEGFPFFDNVWQFYILLKRVIVNREYHHHHHHHYDDLDEEGGWCREEEKSGVNVWFLAPPSLLSPTIVIIMMVMMMMMMMPLMMMIIFTSISCACCKYKRFLCWKIYTFWGSLTISSFTSLSIIGCFSLSITLVNFTLFQIYLFRLKCMYRGVQHFTIGILGPLVNGHRPQLAIGHRWLMVQCFDGQWLELVIGHWVNGAEWW